jgi:hypothetical protein
MSKIRVKQIIGLDKLSFYIPTSGNTDTNIANGLYATTISATTYLNLPIDVYVTGGTYNSGTLTLTNNTGGTFNVTGFSTSGGTVSGDYLPLSGGTVSGGTSFISGLTANTIYTNYIDFNTGATVTQSQGRMSWDSGTGTLNVTIGDSTTGLLDLQVGQEEMVRVYNDEATTLVKGEIVYVSGSQGNRPTVKRAIANGDGYSVTTLGMVDSDILSGTQGYITTFGIISNLNTLGLSGGTPIWLSPTVSGGYTSTKPQAPDHTVLIGYVVRVSATVGSIFINISNGWEIDELHDVRISAATEGDLLLRSSYSGTPVWVNTKTLPGSYTITGNTTVGGNLVVSGNSGINWFSSNTSTDLVRITQTGSGNALVVEDSTNPDSTPFVVTKDGRVGVGISTPFYNVDIIDVDPQFRVSATTNNRAFRIYPGSGTIEADNTSFYLNRVSNTNILLGFGGGNTGVGTISSPTAKLHINNTGTSNSLLVEDSTNPDSTPFVVDNSGNVGIGLTGTTYKLDVAGQTRMSGSGQNILTIVGSGNSTSSPLFSVQGSSGELFSVTDSLIGSLFSVNDISGLPILEVFSDNTILAGSYQAPSLNTTKKLTLSAGTNTIYTIPTSAYTGAFMDYTLISSGATGARAGNVMSIWSGTTTQYTDAGTNDIGDTSGVSFSVSVSGNNAILSSSATTSGWTLKTILRSI